MERRRSRRSIRMQGYDYNSPGSYFVTICTQDRNLLFDDPILAGIAEEQWHGLPSRFPSVKLDAFVVMPNHIHGTLWLDGPVGAPLAGARTSHGATEDTGFSITGRQRAGASPAPTLGTVICSYKSLVATTWLSWIKANDPSRSARVWQRNYYEHVIRNEDELNRIREYIALNPKAWEHDHENPARVANADYEKAWSAIERFL